MVKIENLNKERDQYWFLSNSKSQSSQFFIIISVSQQKFARNVLKTHISYYSEL